LTLLAASRASVGLATALGCTAVSTVLLWSALNSLSRSRVRLEAEILIFRQQINVSRRNPKRFVFRTLDRLMFVGLYRLVPGVVDALVIVLRISKPDGNAHGPGQNTDCAPRQLGPQSERHSRLSIGGEEW
jgi:hypothetical protein